MRRVAYAILVLYKDVFIPIHILRTYGHPLSSGACILVYLYIKTDFPSFSLKMKFSTFSVSDTFFLDTGSQKVRSVGQLELLKYRIIILQIFRQGRNSHHTFGKFTAWKQSFQLQSIWYDFQCVSMIFVILLFFLN